MPIMLHLNRTNVPKWRWFHGMIERHVNQFYNFINISEPCCLSIETVSSKINLDVYYWDRTSTIIDLINKHSVFINKGLTKQGQWQDFGHEMKHFFYDGGSQDNLKDSFKCYQEVKADYFAYHFCVPTFMLRQLRGVTAYDIARIFNVEIEFAFRRLEMYKNSIISVNTIKLMPHRRKI